MKFTAKRNLDYYLAHVERRYLTRAILEAGGSGVGAAKTLGIAFRSFRYKLKKHGLAQWRRRIASRTTEEKNEIKRLVRMRARAKAAKILQTAGLHEEARGVPIFRECRLLRDGFRPGEGSRDGVWRGIVEKKMTRR